MKSRIKMYVIIMSHFITSAVAMDPPIKRRYIGIMRLLQQQYGQDPDLLQPSQAEVAFDAGNLHDPRALLTLTITKGARKMDFLYTPGKRTLVKIPHPDSPQLPPLLSIYPNQEESSWN